MGVLRSGKMHKERSVPRETVVPLSAKQQKIRLATKWTAVTGETRFGLVPSSKEGFLKSYAYRHSRPYLPKIDPRNKGGLFWQGISHSYQLRELTETCLDPTNALCKRRCGRVSLQFAKFLLAKFLLYTTEVSPVWMADKRRARRFGVEPILETLKRLQPLLTSFARFSENWQGCAMQR